MRKTEYKSGEETAAIIKETAFGIYFLLRYPQQQDTFQVDLFKQIPDLRVIYLQGNPVIKKIKHYRKTITAMLPTLKYLDDRPIFPEDRLRAEAFAKGLAEGGVKAGQAAERAEIKRQREEKKRKEDEKQK